MAKKKSDDLPKISIDKVEFFITRDKKEGMARIDYSKSVDGNFSDISIDMPLTSIWIDQDSGNAIRAHLRLGKSYQQAYFFADVLKLRRVNVKGALGIQASPTSAQRVMIYGMDGKSLYQKYDTNDSKSKFFYSSKGRAFRDILEHIANFRAIGGLNVASLSRISDNTLISTGFEKVEDLLGNGPPMWHGSPEILKEYRGYSQEDKEERAGVIDSFLKSIDKELKSAA